LSTTTHQYQNAGIPICLGPTPNFDSSDTLTRDCSGIPIGPEDRRAVTGPETANKKEAKKPGPSASNFLIDAGFPK
jgi:hypothetical protein